MKVGEQIGISREPALYACMIYKSICVRVHYSIYVYSTHPGRSAVEVHGLASGSTRSENVRA